MKKFVCPKCTRSVASEFSLQRHLKKNLPCDFQCRLCEFKGKNRHQYYRHMKRNHPDEVIKRKKQKIEPKVDKRQKQSEEEEIVDVVHITPLEDFRWEFTNEIDGFDVTVTIRAKTMEARERLQKMLARITPHSVMDALRFLDQDSSESNMERAVTEALHRVHTMPNYPEMHSICLSDISRRSVQFYSRPDPTTDHCQWITHPRESSLDLLVQHARNLFSCLLEIGFASLVIQVYRGQIVFTMQHSKQTLMVRYEKDWDMVSARVRYNAKQEEYDECPPSRTEEAAQHLHIIEERKTEVMQRIKEAMPQRDHLIHFLDRGRPVCYPTLISVNRPE